MSPLKGFLFWAIRSAYRSKNVLWQKTLKVDFSPNLVVLGFYCSYTKFHIFNFYTFYTKTLGSLYLCNFLQIFLAKN